MEVQPLRSRHLATLTLLAAVGVGTLAGCAHRVEVPRSPADVPGYHRAPADLAHEDVSALRGRRIVVDPGHGGCFPGAVGDGGLTEAEVNLGVALYLQGLLQWAGAEVHLTRTADVDFVTPADSSVAGDLAARMAMVDRLRPDVFLSIHHNSTASRDPAINETQTYYPLGREGADRDLALAVHRQLVRALEIEPARILPGGFYVLRNSPVPAVLGEPAMISNPVMEGRLTLARSLELEARAYFLGLRDYFAAGSPTWSSESPDSMLVATEAQELSWRFDPGHPGAPGLDPATLALWIDGQRAAIDGMSPDGLTITAGVPTTTPSTRVELRARNLRGRTATSAHVLRRADLRRDPPSAVGRQRLTDGPGSERRWVEADGLLPILRDHAGRPAWPESAAPPPEPVILLPGLHGLRIAIDARGGGSDHRTTGRLGARGSDVNLMLADRLAALLRGAGCRVLLVRDDDLYLPDPDRVARADAFAAELYLTIDHGPAAVGHHPGSKVGRPWAQHLAGALDPLLPDTVHAVGAHDHVLRHTACPAVVVSLGSLTDPDAERRHTDPAWQDAVARALLRGIVTVRSPDAAWLSPPSLLAGLGPRAIAPAALDHVRLDGNFTWLPGTGRADDESLPSWHRDDPGLPIVGPHHVLELHAGPLWQVWTLVRRPDGQWLGQIFLENR